MRTTPLAPLALLLATTLAWPAFAAPIVWSPATDTTGKSQLVEGSVVLALNGGSESPAVANAGSGGTASYSFTAANFTTLPFIPTGADAGDTPTSGRLSALSVYGGAAMTSTGDTNFDELVGSLTYAKGTPTGIQNGTLTFSGLTPDADYLVQLFYNDQRNDKTLTLGDGLGSSVTIASGATPGSQINDYGQHAIGSFTAGASTQAVTLQSTAGNIHLNAILLVQSSAVAPPDTPSGLAAFPGNNRVSLRWDANTQAGFDHFVVKRSTAPGGPYTPLPGATPAIGNHIDTTALNGTTYHYVVSAINELGAESADSPGISATPDASFTQPNILILYLDDQDPAYGCYGNTLTHTPNIDTLAAAGRRFTRTHVANPVCSPSHTSLFTGNYVTTLGCPHHRSHYIDQLPDGHGSLPQLLADAGYFTVNLDNGSIRWGASGKTDLNFNREGQHFQHTQDFIFTGPNATPYCEPETIFMGGVWSNRQPGQPFFAYANIETGKAHGFGTGTTWAEAAGVDVDPDDVVLPPYLADLPIADWRDYVAQSYNSVSATDFVVGKFLEGLELGGEAGNTLVILASDHGRATMRHKQNLYQTGIHVPMILRWPGQITPGSVETELTSIIDIAATCVGAAGAARPPKMEGLDLLNDDLAARRHVFASRDGVDGIFDRSRAVVGDRYKYIRHFYPELPYINGSYATGTLNGRGMENHVGTGEMTAAQEAFLLGFKPREELYDLDTDPWEITNLAANPAHAALLEEHRTLLSDQMLSTGDYRAHASILLGDIAAGTSVNTVENAAAQLLVDSDGDGLNDYLEALLGLDPNVQDAQHATDLALQPDGDAAYTVRNLRDDFRYTVQISTDLDDWQAFTTLEGVTGGSPSVVTLPASLSEPDGALFTRLFFPQ